MRPKGTKNKRTLEIEELFEKLDFNPIEFLAQVASGKVTEFIQTGIDEETGKAIGYQAKPKLALRVECAKELAQYIAPKQRAIEVNADIGPIEVKIVS